jgi:hydroxyacylglutathione hydrolase
MSFYGIPFFLIEALMVLSESNRIMNLFVFEVNPFSENTYVLINGSRALIFDPGFFDATEYGLLTDLLEKQGATPEAILLTHAHLDHLFGVQRVKETYQIPVYLHPDDTPFWDNFDRMGANYGIPLTPLDFRADPILPGLHTIAGVEIEARFTPGHAPGHLSFYIPALTTVISGDALFRDTVGRTDLPMGDFETLAESIRTQLYTLPEETVVMPGHGPKTTIGYEILNNGFVKGR